MASLQLSNPATSPTIVKAQQLDVQLRKNWTDEWKSVKYLEALECSKAAAPGVPTARLRWRSGLIKWEDQNFFFTRYERDWRGWFVRINLLNRGAAPVALFTGRICDDDESVFGPGRLGDYGFRNADQEMTAFGLAHELDRAHIVGSWITNDGLNASQISVSLTFNERFVRGQRELGNRSLGRCNATIDGTVRKACAFSAARSNGFAAFPWTAREIAVYLLAFYAPKGQKWRLAGQLDALDKLEPPRFSPHGMTVWEALNEVIDRRRGVGFTVDCPGDDPTITVFTTVGKAVKFDTASLPANTRAGNISLNLGHEIQPPSIRVDSCAAYDWIQVIGEPVLACFTVSYEDGTLIKGWTADKETAYKTGASSDGRRNDDERATDKFSHVFQKFLIPETTWDWKASNGQQKTTGAAKNLVHRLPSEEGKLIRGSQISGTFRKWGHTLAATLPLVKDERDTAANTDFQPEYRQPFALLYDEILKTFRYADNPSMPDDIPASLRMLDQEFGFLLNCQPNHLLAYNHFAGAGESHTQPKFDWQKIVATVAARQDCALGVTVKVSPPKGDGRRVLVIRVPDAELWHVVPGTVLDVEKGVLKRQQNAQTLRDDSARLRQIAAVALAWYGDDHAVLNVTFNSLTPYDVGLFVRKATEPTGDRDINSVISSVNFDLVNQRTTIQTNYGEMDFVTMGGTGQGYRSIR